jgi:hypothetical protein
MASSHSARVFFTRKCWCGVRAIPEDAAPAGAFSLENRAIDNFRQKVRLKLGSSRFRLNSFPFAAPEQHSDRNQSNTNKSHDAWPGNSNWVALAKTIDSGA